MTGVAEPLEDLERFDSDMKRWAARVVRAIRRQAAAGTLPELSEDLPGEEWRDVPGERGYVVSSLGRVRSMGAVAPRFRPARDLKLSPNGKGYLAAGVNGRNRKVHRLVASAFVPNPEGFPLVRHLNDVKTDNRVVNLAWGDERANAADARRNGIRPTAQHGTVSMYSSQACRCDPCRAAARAYQLKYRTHPDRRAALAAAQRARRTDPEYRAAERARRATPEYRAAKNAARRARYAIDPAYRAAKGAANNAARRAKRAAQQKELTE